MEFLIKEQPIEIITFEEFLQENYKRAVEFKNAFLKENEERLKNNEAESVYSSYEVQQTRKEGKYVSSGMFRKNIRFTKKDDNSYVLQDNHTAFIFSSNQVLFILPNGVATPINLYHKDFLIK